LEPPQPSRARGLILLGGGHVGTGEGEDRTHLALVRLARAGPADLVVAGQIHENPSGPVEERRTARRIQPDGVALDHVPLRARPEELDPDRAVAGDQVPRAGRGPADRVVRGVVDEDAVGAIGDRGVPPGIGADEIGLDQVPHGRRARDLQADESIAREDVPLDRVAG